jgi:hypothetical protein
VPTEEYWVCRKSVHENAPVNGSAPWEEFQFGLRENRAENEKEYTPSVTGVERLLEWPTEGEIVGGWQEVEMCGKYILRRLKVVLVYFPFVLATLVPVDYPVAICCCCSH